MLRGNPFKPMKVDTTNSRVFRQGSFAWQLGKTLCTVMRFAVTIFLTTSSIQCLAEDKEHKTTTKEIYGPAGRIHIDDGGAGGVPVVFVH
jgi:hypothetical protein